jgi:Protein of unknown function (DUF3102)
MNDQSKAVAPATIAPAQELLPPGTLSLPELAEKLNYEHRQLKECVIKGAHHAIKAGELLWEAKRKAGHGRWLDWLAENCEFSERTAQIYMKLANELRLANPQRIADLSLTAAIEMIEDLKAPEGDPIPKVRTTKKTDKLAEAIKNAPFAILERAWDQASENERSIFLKKIGAGP